MAGQVSGDKTRTPAERANDAKAPFDGPHKPQRKKIKSEIKEDEPAFVVSVKRKEIDPTLPPEQGYTYNPKELREKARAFLKNGNLDAKQRNVLEEILGPDKEEV